ncbi:ABC transporter permease subunit [Bacillus sp. ISL-35]|uniref:ABC transporter permease subunit n=1 Tax=Bacillus sp. ISL-35 TaxID=2819122 RepID=UPI001BE6607F|nr:ABC transporter permease subunit [Bacillus sp. ISL-35]MBT2680974.1 ABC transporter permease subunit [Bacillus sp. ISL-35]MBT2705293.1 ABC transporter permease subunit [Chryseobacterium sp. ISL-80]
MYKKEYIGRDLLTILYLTVIFLGIGFYFGAGSITYFFGKMQSLFPIEEIVKKMHDLFLLAVSEGSLGTTRTGEQFEAAVDTYLFKSMPIIITAFVLAVPFGIAKGIFDYRKKNVLTGLGHGLTSFVTSLPDFFLILSLQWIVLYHFRFIDWFGGEEWYNFLLPSVLVALYPLMYLARVTSAALSNEDGAMYIRTARAMGFPEKAVIKKHILKKCMLTITQHIPSVMTYILSNLLMVEWLLDYKGAAWRLLYAIQRSNDPKHNEMGLAVEFSICFMLVLFLSQLLSILLQHKYIAEKFSPIAKIMMTGIRYLFILIFICLLFVLINITPKI